MIKKIVHFSLIYLMISFSVKSQTNTKQQISSNLQIQNSKKTSNPQSKGWLEKIQDPNVNFYEIQSEFNNYWKNRTDYKGNGYKVFKRWEYINKSRILTNGKLQSPDYVQKEYKKYKSLLSNKSAAGNWNFIAPASYPINNTSQPTGMGRINAIAFHPTDPNTIFIGSPSGGFWKTTNHGNLWTNLSSNLPTLGVSSILVHPTNSDIIYIGSGDRDASDAQPMGVFKTTDGGITWTQINNTMGNVTVGAMLMHPSDPNIIIAATSSGIYKTINGGSTWSLKVSGNFKDIKFKPDDPTIVYGVKILTPSEFYRSTNTGDSWTKTTNGIPTTGIGSRMVIGVSAANSSIVYLVQIKSADKNFAGLLKSTDAGLSFTTQSTSPNIFDYKCDGSGTASQATYDLCISADPTNANTIYVGSINNWKSTDGGVNWTIVSHWAEDCSIGISELHADQHVYQWNNGKLYIGHDGGISYTANNGGSWTEITGNLGITQVYRIGQSTSNSSTLLMGLQDNGSGASVGNIFTTTRGGDGSECVIDYSNQNFCYNTYVEGDISRSTTGPTGSYSNIGSTGTNGIGSNETGEWVTPYFLHKTNPSVMFAGYENVFRCDNVKASPSSAVTWAAISTGETTTCTILEQSTANNDIIYVVRSGAMKRTDNANATASSVTWTVCTLPGGITPSDVKTHPTVANIVFASAGYKIYKSADKGITWTDISSNLPSLFINCMVVDKNANEGIYIGNQTSIWYKNATMTDWVLFSTGLPLVDIRELDIFYDPIGTQHRLKAATYGRGVWESDLFESGILNPANFTVTCISNTHTNLSWGLSSGNNIILAYSTSPTFGNPVNGISYSASSIISGGGTVIYNGNVTNFNHFSLNPNTTYYYKIWSYNGTLQYSSGSTANITTTYSLADFVANKSLSCSVGLTVNFTDASIGTYNSWAWDIDNNGTTDYTTQNPTHTYSNPGLYSVKLTINNGAATTTKENLILVMNSEPTVNTGCALASNINSGNSFGIGLSRFALGNIDNTTSNNDGYYKNYCCIKSTVLELNKSYNITITTGTANNEGARVYIDYNDNGIFDAIEYVAEFPSNKTGTRTISYTTPSTGTVLDKGLRLRVLSKYSGIPTTGCDISSYGQAEDYTVYFTSDASWTGTVSTDWNTSGNWSYNAVPGATINSKIISGAVNYPIISSNIISKNLTIQSGASVTISSGKALSVSGNLINNAGNTGLIIKSNSSLLHNSENVPATVEREINAANWSAIDEGWHLLSSPVLNQSISGNFTPNGIGNDYDFFAWDEAAYTWLNQKVSINNINTFNSAVGYLVAYQQTGTKIFTGNLHNSDITIPLSFSYTDANDKGYNLLGNPYTTALDWNYSAWDKTILQGANAKIWESNAKQWTDISLLSIPNIIPANQGFLVKALNSGNFAIKKDARILNNQNFYKSTPDLLILKAEKNGSQFYDKMAIKFDNTATFGYNPNLDVTEFETFGESPSIYSVLINGEKLSINSIPEQLPANTFINIDFKANINGVYSINATIPLHTTCANLVLEDLKTNTIQDLNQNHIYSFNALTTDNENRFKLHFGTTVNTKEVDINSPNIYANANIIFLNYSDNTNQIQIYNTLGQLIINLNNINGIKKINMSNYANGYYLVKIITEKNVISQKVFLEKISK